MNVVDQEIKEIILNKQDIIEYKISEIEFITNEENQNQKIINVKNKIEKDGFENTAKELSISTTAVNGGDLG